MAVGLLMNPLFVFEQSTADEATDKCRKTVVACVKVTSNSSPKLLAVCFMTAMKYAAPTTFFTFGVIHTLQTSEEWNWLQQFIFLLVCICYPTIHCMVWVYRKIPAGHSLNKLQFFYIFCRPIFNCWNKIYPDARY